jgi:hypothetical protein
MSPNLLSHPPWRLKKVIAAITIGLLVASVSSQSPSEESSRDLTKKLLKMDLGYNVLNNEMFRKSMGVSVDSLDDLDDDDDSVAEGSHRRDERLPVPQHLVRDEDVFRYGGPNPDGLWSDEKFWGPGLPNFFGGAFGGGNPRPAAPQRHGGGGRRPQVRADAPNKRQLVGDQHQCGSGSCEFFLFCWLSGGTVEGGCGGFIFACCKRAPSHHASYEEAPKVIAAQVRFLPTCPPSAAGRKCGSAC